MGFQCPHCTKEIDNAVSKTEHLSRIGVKEEENKALKDALKDAQSTATSAAALQTERDQLKTERAQLQAEIEKRDRQMQRGSAFDEAGIPVTPAVRKGFELVYDSEQAGVESPVGFEDWLAAETTKAHPLLTAHFAKPQQQQGQQGATSNGTNGQQANGASSNGTTNGNGHAQANGAGSATNGQQRTVQTQRPQGGLTNVDRGAAPPSDTDTGPKTAEEINAYFRSEEYRALPLDKQRERKAELRARSRVGARQG